ncbi:hypothetical protein GHT06_015895 [Daphnia sinensis]|uniref:Uncharacterized protein n=1 Tax=Daphnia sinensis TaxID=1820382 RepID=A0AAD5LAG3_9CRUS|nr:hypothetical protein GHT06_015895 [Daphnia sinensis]
MFQRALIPPMITTSRNYDFPLIGGDAGPPQTTQARTIKFYRRPNEYSITTTAPLRKIPCHHAPARHPISSPVTSRTLRLKRRAKGYMGGDGKGRFGFVCSFNSDTSASFSTRQSSPFIPFLIKESTHNLHGWRILFFGFKNYTVRDFARSGERIFCLPRCHRLSAP